MFQGLLSRLRLAAPTLTPVRVRTAFAVAIATDVLQFVLGPFGWVGADELLDVIAAGATFRLLGFHPLLLPTFMIEFLPLTDMLPTWTACVALVVSARRSQQVAEEPPPPEPGQVIDVKDFRST